MNHTIPNHINPVFDQMCGLPPKIKTFIITIIKNGSYSEHRVKAESQKKAESNLMKFTGSNIIFDECKEL